MHAGRPHPFPPFYASPLDSQLCPLRRPGKDFAATMDPTRRQLRSEPTWKDKAMLAILLVCAHHLRATTSGPLAVADLARLVTARTFPEVVDLLEASPEAAVRAEAHTLRATLTGAGDWTRGRVMAGLPAALTDPYFRLDLARAAARAGLDLFPQAR